MCVLGAGCDGAFDLVHVQPPDAGIDAPAIPSGLIAWFPMDSVTTTTEERVAAHHATCSQLACPTPTEGKRGGALAFDGVSKRLDVPAFAELDTSTGFTVAAWLRQDGFPPSDGYGCALVKKFTNVDSSWQICLSGVASRLEMWAYSSLLHAPWPGPDGWVHVGGVWDGSMFGLFIDGVPQLPFADLSTVLFDGGPLVIGTSDAGGTVNPFKGALDDVRIYNRPLSEAEVQELYAGP
jgi:hypothetical protein